MPCHCDVTGALCLPALHYVSASFAGDVSRCLPSERIVCSVLCKAQGVTRGWMCFVAGHSSVVVPLQEVSGWTSLMDAAMQAAAAECGADEAAVRAAARTVPIASEIVQVRICAAVRLLPPCSVSGCKGFAGFPRR